MDRQTDGCSLMCGRRVHTYMHRWDSVLYRIQSLSHSVTQSAIHACVHTYIPTAPTPPKPKP
ncbi:uncharacterized protein K452DRAFT_102018 [Aplosporella prunicola CBS 121167]|uniref:Uncharacterized protein n=1 Tax=Aplosporella prunicola CBS 121167 TaxID=1176127 RepID=A0A6A6B0I1_9PEZI|nr:uncharacterized protein K452DRAFT_102018 [Aplosporella prunicola CBS 121167]KAF2137530.1 hypothetical protein K452DRAFT_102018 [Aplosporella prunicola CBS 121167]